VFARTASGTYLGNLLKITGDQAVVDFDFGRRSLACACMAGPALANKGWVENKEQAIDLIERFQGSDTDTDYVKEHLDKVRGAEGDDAAIDVVGDFFKNLSENQKAACTLPALRVARSKVLKSGEDVKVGDSKAKVVNVEAYEDGSPPRVWVSFEEGDYKEVDPEDVTSCDGESLSPYASEMLGLDALVADGWNRVFTSEGIDWGEMESLVSGHELGDIYVASARCYPGKFAFEVSNVRRRNPWRRHLTLRIGAILTNGARLADVTESREDGTWLVEIRGTGEKEEASAEALKEKGYYNAAPIASTLRDLHGNPYKVGDKVLSVLPSVSPYVGRVLATEGSGRVWVNWHYGSVTQEDVDDLVLFDNYKGQGVS